MENIGYVSLEYSDEYISKHFITTDTLRINWESLSTENKETLLRKSFETLELLPFTGRKYSLDQPNAFPRWPNEEVPVQIKAAQIENALALSDDSTNEDAAFYEKLWQFGVESYSIGNLSEKTSQGAWGRSISNTSGIVSSKASKLLQPFISGSYNIRGIYNK